MASATLALCSFVSTFSVLSWELRLRLAVVVGLPRPLPLGPGLPFLGKKRSKSQSLSKLDSSPRRDGVTFACDVEADFCRRFMFCSSFYSGGYFRFREE